MFRDGNFDPKSFMCAKYERFALIILEWTSFHCTWSYQNLQILTSPVVCCFIDIYNIYICNIQGLSSSLEDEDVSVVSNIGETLSELHGIKCQKTCILNDTAVRT